MYTFDYIRARSVTEAANAGTADTEARYLAGGQTLIPTLKQHLAKPTKLIDIGRIGDLKGIHMIDNAIGIGAMTTHAEVAGHAGLLKACPALCRLASEIADPSVRARGTIGGSLANNDPAADYPAAVLGLGATITTSKRNILADDFFRGLFTTALEPGEIITGVGFQVPEKAGYAKFAQPASRFALVGVFVAKTSSGVRVAVTGASESGVFRAMALEQALTANFDPSAVTGVSIPSAAMLSDVHGGADYRAALIPVMAERAVAMANAS